MKRTLLFFIMVLVVFASTTLNAETMGTVKTHLVLDAVSVTGTGASVMPLGTNRTFQGSGATTTGAGACVMLVEVSNDNTVWDTGATLTLVLGASTTSTIEDMDDAWKYVRGNVVSISGTNATVTLNMGVQL